MNPMLLTDSYKLTHWKQYPPKTTGIYSYFEARSDGKAKEQVFFGLQYQLYNYLAGPVVTPDAIRIMEAFVKDHLGSSAYFNRTGWEHIAKDHRGLLPLRIKAVPEGTVVPSRNVLMTVENTCPQCYWLPNYMETLLVQTWYPSTVATISREVKKTILSYLERNGTPADIMFKLHDFGYRGSTSVESAGIGGGAHLVNFMGTDTLAALMLVGKFYDAGMAGFSIPAAEHSTITSWGRDHEVAAYRNMVDQYPTGLMACVSDSYDIFDACRRIWGSELKDRVLARDGCLVIRPDSGYPPKVVIGVLDILGEVFGVETNSKGQRVIDRVEKPRVRIIQGDGCTPDMIQEILHQMSFKGWSADNIAFGMGGGLLQKCDRDTYGYAFKCAAIQEDGGQWRDVYKEPKTDDLKTSKRGRMILMHTPEGSFQTRPEVELHSHSDALETVFENGFVLVRHKFSDVRDRAAIVSQPLVFG